MLQLPDPEDATLSEIEFQQQITLAWQVCDRFDLQTDIWRGRILRMVRDREKNLGEGRGIGFLNWLKEREITKSHAYNLIELANSADEMLAQGALDPEDVNQFTKRAFIETAQSAPEVQQMIVDTAKQGNRITRREVKQLADEWTAMTSELLPEEVREKAADQTIPPRYLAPLVKQMEKLPAVHQVSIREAVADSPDLDTLKQVTAEARYLARYLESANQVQVFTPSQVDLELALEEALRIGTLTSTAEIVNQAAQLENAIAKLYTTWRRLNQLSERLYVDTGASTPHLRGLLNSLDRLSGEVLEVTLGDPNGEGFSRTIRLKIDDSPLDSTSVSTDSAIASLPLEVGQWDS
ncbi:MAG: hypothetical protein VKJ24_17370 [Synechococcales bacterium]|nr:hypothetical protein [Synechococcales bacterium]